ncbi:MAG: discoidin domain-containing protein [Clostridia bacterium]|nr:discoidin domain-containing protein [Clostridia bacterium]
MNKIFKKFLSGMLSAGMIVSSLPAFAAENSELLYNQSFNSTSTNEVPANISVVGRGARVAEYDMEEKALRFELTGGLQMAEVSVPLSGKFFISFDISSTGKLNGGVKLKNSSGGEFSVLQFAKGMLCTHNGSEVTGINKNMQNVTIEFNVDKSRYSLYVGGKCMKNNYYVASFAVKEPTSVLFELSSSVGGTALLDNINIGKGKAMSSYPKALYDPSVTEYSEKSHGVTDKVYTLTDFTEGKRVAGAYQYKDNILQQYNDETGEGVCLFKRKGAQDFHLDMNTQSYTSDSLVYEFDVKLKSSDVQFISTIKSKTSNYFRHFSVVNGTLTAGNSRIKLPVDEWQTISTVYNVIDSTYDVYLNYELIAKELPVDYRYRHDEAMTWRIHVDRMAGDDEFHVDNMVVYGGVEPKENLEVSGGAVLAIEDDQSAHPSDDKTIAYLTDKVSYHTRSGLLYANGEKTIIKPVIENGTTMVPLMFFKTAFGSDINFDSITNKGSIDGVTFMAYSDKMDVSGKEQILPAPAKLLGSELYVPLRAVATEGLGKEFVYDNSTISGGMILMSDKKIILPEGDELQRLNDFALYERPTSEKITADYNASALKGVHPRVMADKSDFDRIKALMNTDETMKKWAKGMINSADGYLKDTTPLVYELRDGVRLWYVSLDMIRNMTVLGMAYQLTGDKKYADRAWIDLESVSNFPSWHPEHHIDVGGLAVGVAIGYDWMYDAFTPEQRAIIEKGAYQNGFFDYVEGYQGRSSLMSGGITNTANHNQVMNAGGATLALAFMDIYPREAAYCVAESLRCVEYAIKGYAPEGSWYEGMGYGSMSLEYLSYQLASIKKVLNTVYSMDATDGLDKVSQFYLYMQSSMGCIAYADGSSQAVAFDPMAMWLCDHYGEHETISALSKMFDFPLSVRGMLWYRPEQLSGDMELSLDHIYSDQQLVSMRDSWDREKHTVLAGLKGGTPGAAHGHMDVGKFDFYANGIQWTLELSSDNYNLPNYFSDADEASPRWSYYRMRAEAHSTIFINPDEYGEYDPNVKAMMTRFESKPRGAIAVLDMTDTHLGKAKKAERAMQMTDDRRSIVLRDEIELTNDNSKVYWHMITDKKAEVNADGKSVKVSDPLNPNNYITIDFVSNQNFRLSVVPCEPLPTSPHPDGIADDTRKTTIRLELTASGNVNITAKFTPCTVEDGADVNAFDMPIASWTIADGEIPERPVLDRISVGGVTYNNLQTLINHILPSSATSVPDVIAESTKYNVSINKAADLDGCTLVIVSDKNEPTRKTIYKIYYNKMKQLPVDNVTECEIVKLEPSSEPQAENPASSLIDRNLATRWSAEGAQYIIVDLGKVTEFDKVIMSFMSGDSRNYSLRISVSADNIEYTEVFNGTSSGKSSDYEIFDIGLQSARYVKIDGNGYYSSNGGVPGTWNSWTEVSIAKAK